MTTTVTEKRFLDIDLIIAESNNPFLKRLPRSIVRVIRKIICQDELNRHYNRIGDYQGLDFVNQLINELSISFEVEGFSNIDSDNRYVFFGNHSLGALDGLVLMKIVHEKMGEMKFVVNELFRYLPNIDSLVVGVNVFKGNNREAIKRLNNVYASNLQVLTFPAGEVSRIHQNKVCDGKWQKSFLQKAIETKRALVPFYVHNINSTRFYRIYKWRKRLGIKANIELLFLPSEMLRQQGKTIRITFGQPIPFDQFDDQFTTDQWVNQLKSHVYQLGDKHGLIAFAPK